MTGSGELLAGGSYAAGGLTWATFVAAVAVFTLGAFALARGRSTVSRLFFLFTAAAAAWLLSFALMYAARRADVALVWARVASLAAAFIPPAVFDFSAAFVGRRHALRPVTIAFWLVCGAVGIATLVTPLFVPEVQLRPWGWFPVSTIYNGVWLLIYSAFVVAGLRLFAKAWREGRGESRDRAGALLVAFIIGCLAMIDFLPSIGADVQPVGFMAILGFVIVAAAAVARYRLGDVTPQIAASQILETMKGSVLVVDMQGRIRVANSAASTLLGYEPERLRGMHIRSIIDPEATHTTGQLLQSIGVLETEMRWRGAAGAAIDVLASSSLVRDADGTPVAVVYVASDYTERRRAEQALRESERRYRTLFDANPLPMWIYDSETLRFVAVNDAAVRHYGWSRDEFLRMSIADIRPVEEIPGMRAELRRVAGYKTGRLFRHLKKDGSVIDVEVTSVDLHVGGRPARVVIAQDVTERRRADDALRESERRYRELVENATEAEARFRLLFERNLAGVFRGTIDGRILECNDALARIFGFDSREELMAQQAGSRYDDPDERPRLIQQLRSQRTLANVELRMRKRDGTPIWILENVSLLEGDILEGTIVDITDRKTAQEQMEYQAYHDVLTDLPNRLLFRDRITVALAHAKRSGRNAAVMFLDLDQFKLVNDTLGHTVGDGLLQAIATRLVGCVRAEDTVARMGGDEFTVLLSDLHDRRAAATVAQKVIDAVRRPVEVDGHELFVTTSIGISMFPDDGGDAETLLKNADRAMYRAKELGRNNFQYASGISGFDGRLLLERHLHHALEREEFVVHYQPMVEIATGHVVGVEALVRWQHPEKGLMQPEDFIQVAEESQLIVPLGEWVLRRACRDMKRWHDAGHDHLRVAVNLSPRQFQQRDLPGMIERVLEESGLPPSALDLEITETAAMQNAELSLSILNRLKEMGIRISIDDFGKGYSSLAYLKRFPIDTVKIDQEFVRDLGGSNCAIVSAMISMARALNLSVIAEGVETEEQRAFLLREQCPLMQGFLYSKPLLSEEFEARLTVVASGM